MAIWICLQMGGTHKMKRVGSPLNKSLHKKKEKDAPNRDRAPFCTPFVPIRNQKENHSRGPLYFEELFAQENP